MNAPNVYDGPTDDRQSDYVAIPPSRFRPRYRALSPAEINIHDRIKDAATVLEKLFDEAGHGRYHALAVTSLELAVMWAVKELTA